MTAPKRERRKPRKPPVTVARHFNGNDAGWCPTVNIHAKIPKAKRDFDKRSPRVKCPTCKRRLFAKIDRGCCKDHARTPGAFSSCWSYVIPRHKPRFGA